MNNLFAHLSYYIPELMAVITMIGLLFMEATYKDNHKRKFVFIGGYIGLFSCLIALFLNLDVSKSLFTNSVIVDPFSTWIKIVMVLGAFVSVHLAEKSKEIPVNFKTEFFILAIGILIGGMLLASANNMLTVYLGVETLSILSYVMASVRKNDEKSSEAGLKYVLYGGVSAAIMLFGIGHIYGVLGTIHFFEMGSKLNELSSMEVYILLPAFLFFFTGIGYKIACVPFHMWSPDVYEGSPTPVTMFFAVVPKIAGMAALVRIGHLFFAQEGIFQTSWIGLLQVIAAITMTVGNISAIGQQSVKRMLAWSSISHVGVILLGLVSIDEIGMRTIMFYLLVYVFMTLVAFFITALIASEYDNDHFERFNGLLKIHPITSIALITVMFSLAGLPPLSGFVAKFNILSVIVAKKYYTLALITVLNSVISLYYYMKIIRFVVFGDKQNNKIAAMGFLNQTIIVSLTIPVIFFGIFWEKILSVSNEAKILIQQ